MRKETEPESPILAVCRTLEKQSEVPCNNDLLHSTIKGTEPRENRRLNELFWEVPNFYTRSAGAAGTNCVLWEEKGALPCSVAGPGYTCHAPQECPAGPRAQTWGGCRAGQRLPHLGSLGAGTDEEQVGHLTGLQGYLNTLPALGTAGTVFGTEGLNRVKLLIKAVLGSWLWDLLVTELALHQKPGKSKRLVGISFLPFSPKAVC